MLPIPILAVAFSSVAFGQQSSVRSYDWVAAGSVSGSLKVDAGEIDPAYAEVAEHMPAAVRRSMLASDMDVNDENAERYAQSAQALRQLA